MIAENEIQVQADILTLIQDAVRETTNELLKKLEDYITEDVYNAYKPFWYKRTEGMINAWEATEPELINGEIVSTIQYNDELFHRDEGWAGSSWQHNYDTIDVDGLIGVITTDYEVGNICNFPSNEVMHRGNFWADFTQYVKDNKDEILRKNLAKRGLNLGI